MVIKFNRSNINKINEYVKLYRRCFSDYPINKNELYFEWLYKNNPLGEFIGIDAFNEDKKLEIGQVGGIPYEFNHMGKKIKILQSINVCVDKNYRGKKLFTEMANRLEVYAKEQGYSYIIAIANKLATPAWQQSISMKFLSKLDVLFGYGDLGINDLKLDEEIFRSIWNKDRINWRRNNPYNKVFIHKKKKIKLVSLSVLSIFDIFSYIEDKNCQLDFDKNRINILPNLFIGLAPEGGNKNFFLRIPEFLKPSPLNFLYKDIGKNNIILDKKKCFFTYLDFDAY
jgi:GNAT superfamily N-acetyltransferase